VTDTVQPQYRQSTHTVLFWHSLDKDLVPVPVQMEGEVQVQVLEGGGLVDGHLVRAAALRDPLRSKRRCTRVVDISRLPITTKRITDSRFCSTAARESGQNK